MNLISNSFTVFFSKFFTKIIFKEISTFNYHFLHQEMQHFWLQNQTKMLSFPPTHHDTDVTATNTTHLMQAFLKRTLSSSCSPVYYCLFFSCLFLIFLFFFLHFYFYFYFYFLLQNFFAGILVFSKSFSHGAIIFVAFQCFVIIISIYFLFTLISFQFFL